MFTTYTNQNLAEVAVGGLREKLEQRLREMELENWTAEEEKKIKQELDILVAKRKALKTPIGIHVIGGGLLLAFIYMFYKNL